MFLENRKIISKLKRSKVTDYAALIRNSSFQENAKTKVYVLEDSLGVHHRPGRKKYKTFKQAK